jgi:hypothetical protein
MKVSFVPRMSVFIVVLLLATGCAERHTVYVQSPAPSPSAAVEEIVFVKVQPPSGENAITEAPPAPQVEVVGAAPGRDYVWMPGVWQWHGGWVWVSGRWVIAPRLEAVWVPGHWTHRRQGWTWIHGYWR